MSSLDYITSSLLEAGYVVHNNGHDVKVSFSSTPALIWITEDSEGIGATLFAGTDYSCNAWAHEEELFTYRNPKAVVEAVKRLATKCEL